MASSAFNARQRGLALLGRLNRWLIAGAIALSGGLSVAAANTFHGRTRGQNTSTSQATAVSHRSSSDDSSSTDSGAGGLQPPAQAPSSAPAPSSGGAVSGGS